jgi:hypothetical protein
VQPFAFGYTSFERWLVFPAFPFGCRMAFSCGRNAFLVMFFPVCTFRPIRSAPRRNTSSFVPIAAVWTGRVCSTHS